MELPHRFTKTFSAGATNQDASDIFGDDYSVDYAKNIVINSGVELGATSTGNEALHIDSGGSGTITVTNNGTHLQVEAVRQDLLAAMPLRPKWLVLLLTMEP